MENTKIVTSFLDGSAYTNINHNMIIGLRGDVTQAFLLSRLLTMYSYFSNNNLLNDGWFFQTVDDLNDNCGISESKQRRAFNELESQGLITTKLRGSPPRRHFKLDIDKVIGLFNISVRTYEKKKEKKEYDIQQKVQTKKEFYDRLNKNLNTLDWSQILESGTLGNIPESLVYLMYKWTDNYSQVNKFLSIYTWEPATYGMIRNYIRIRYHKKKFDLSRIDEYFSSSRNRYFIEDFIKWDRIRVEEPIKSWYSYELHTEVYNNY